MLHDRQTCLKCEITVDKKQEHAELKYGRYRNRHLPLRQRRYASALSLATVSAESRLHTRHYVQTTYTGRQTRPWSDSYRVHNISDARKFRISTTGLYRDPRERGKLSPRRDRVHSPGRLSARGASSGSACRSSQAVGWRTPGRRSAGCGRRGGRSAPPGARMGGPPHQRWCLLVRVKLG